MVEIVLAHGLRPFGCGWPQMDHPRYYDACYRRYRREEQHLTSAAQASLNASLARAAKGIAGEQPGGEVGAPAAIAGGQHVGQGKAHALQGARWCLSSSSFSFYTSIVRKSSLRLSLRGIGLSAPTEEREQHVLEADSPEECVAWDVRSEELKTVREMLLNVSKECCGLT